MTDTLRAALSADQDTPAGVDVAAVRDRAGRLRRTRYAAAGAAAVTALAVAVPVAALRPGGGTGQPVAAPPPPALECPDRLTPEPVGGGPERALAPIAPTAGLVCAYGTPESVADPRDPGPLVGVARIPAAEVTAIAAGLRDVPARTGEVACTQELRMSFGVRLTGPDGAVDLRMDPSGCGSVADATGRVRSALTKQQLLALDRLGRAGTDCPETLARTALVAGPDGGTLLPADTRRLLLCGYLGGERSGERTVVVETAATRRYVAALNAAPAATGPCTREAGPEVLVAAVAPDRVTRVLAQVGACRSVTDGTRSVRDEAVVGELWEAAGR